MVGPNGAVELQQRRCEEQVPSGAQHFLEWLIENLTTVSKDFSSNTSSIIHSLNR
jgi:hypothetical protein